METIKNFSVFAGFKLIASGDLKTVLIKSKEYLDTGGQDQLLIFNDYTGKQHDFNLHGTIEEILSRLPADSESKGPGRPKLGVVSREISLLPRHWEWLDQQPNKSSGTIRRLVETARKNEGNGDQYKQHLEAAGKFMWALTGNLSGFEEASRALYAGKWDVFTTLISVWPEDVRNYLNRLIQSIREIGPAPQKRKVEFLSVKTKTAVPENPALWQLCATELATAIAQGKTTALAVMDAHLSRIKSINPKVNALTAVFSEEARKAAKAIDHRFATGENPGSLAGVPFTIKGNIDVAGYATTHGIPALSRAVAPLDAPLVRRLRAAGAIPIAHTNLPDLSLRFHTFSQLYGATINPWDKQLTPGGSSGGEGVALATGMSPLGLGNDAGGSLRIPALFNGVTALKPGYGRFPGDRSVGPRDQTLASQLILVDGIMARSVADLKLAFSLLAGPDPCDPRVVPAPLRGEPLKRPIRIAVTSNPGNLGVHPEIAAVLETAAGVLRQAGYVTEQVDVPELNAILDAYGSMVMTEFYQNWPMLEKLLGTDGRSYLEFAMSLYKPVDLNGYLQITAQRQGLQRKWAQFFADYPLVLGPVFTEPVVPADFDIRGFEEYKQVSNAMRLCTATSFMGVPAVSVPTGIASGIPQGVQIIAGFYREDLCLEAAGFIEAALGTITPVEPQFL